MSGGSWLYLGTRMLDAADRLGGSDDPGRRALAPLMESLGNAMHAIEWVDSGDMGGGDDQEPIRLALDACCAKASGDTGFMRPFGTIRKCRGCGCLVAGGPTACARCAEAKAP